MWIPYALTLAAILASLFYVPAPPGERYESAKHTQSISVLNERDRIEAVPIADLSDRRWHQPGGMEGITGYTSERFRFIPEGQRVRTWIGNIEVENSIRNGRLKLDGSPDHFRQFNRGLKREYPDGTRFDEVLRNADTGLVFEHRVRLKRGGKWLSEVIHKDVAARPLTNVRENPVGILPLVRTARPLTGSPN